MNKLLTIGIITYNNAPFFDALIYEINNQVINNEELLDDINFYIVDDCSNDEVMVNSLKNLPSFMNKKILSENHQSPAFARNWIIEKANTDYVMFFDGDDVLICNLQELVGEVKTKDANILVSDVIKVGADGRQQKSPFIFSNVLFDNPLLTTSVIEKISVHQTGIWSIYSVAFLKKNNLYYKENIRYEDNYFLTTLYLCNPKIAVLKTKYYGWRNNYKSFSHSNFHIKERIKIYQEIIELLVNHMENKATPWLFYAIWNQTYVNIIREYPKQNLKGYYQYYKALKQVTQKYKTSIKYWITQLDATYIDKYTRVVKYTKLNSFFLVFLFQLVNRIRKSIGSLKMLLVRIFTILPINSRKIFFTSHYGDYNDNSKYLFLELLEDPKYKKCKILFAVKDKELLKENAHFIDYNNKILFFFHHYTSKYIFFNSWYNPEIYKRKNQSWIQLWHGIPYKKIHTDINTYTSTFSNEEKNRRQKSIDNWDVVWSVNQENTMIFKRLFSHCKIHEDEYPKTKWLIDNQSNKNIIEKLKEKYPQIKENSILYAPTYRPYKFYIDLKKVVEFCADNQQLIIHMHPLMNYKVINENVLEGLDVIFLENIADIQEIVLLTKSVITDYSSIAYDYSKIGKNIQYYTPDLSLYNSVHGIYNWDKK